MTKAELLKQEVRFFLEKGILVSPDLMNEETILKAKEKGFDATNALVLSKDIVCLTDKNPDMKWRDFERARVLYEKDKDKKNYLEIIGLLERKIRGSGESRVNVVFSYKGESRKWEIQDFVSYFNARYNEMEKFLRGRQELQNLISINRIYGKRGKENVSLIGLVKSKQTTANGNIIMEIEDPTGSVKVLVSKSKQELFEMAQNIVLDEVVGVSGANSEDIVFANNIIWPDVPLSKELKKSPNEGYALFLSDLHVGSNKFLADKFNNFLEWLNGRVGTNEQKEMIRKIKYIFIVGDLVDGLGIYPEQDSELLIKDIYRQYEECASLLKKIPPHIKLIICPGNHDAMRISEPQPELYRDFAKAMWDLPNTIMVSNPAFVNIDACDGFLGFDVLLYHGYSFDYFVANVDSLRNHGGYNRGDMIMKFLLQKRHLAPTHTSTLYVPDAKKDPLVIDKIPDFFVTGHIHKSVASHFRNITLICGSCWQSKTLFQEKVGHNPEPARVPVVNLKTREVKILKF